MKIYFNYFSLVCTIVFCSIGQIYAQEENVAFDSKKTIFKLTPDIEKQIHLFKGEGQFVDAELFKENDSLFMLEIHYSKNEKIFRDRKSLSLVDVTNLRQKVDSATYFLSSETADAMEGRGFLLGACLVSGLTTYGPAFMGIANSSSTRINTGLYMLGAGGLFFVPFFATKDKAVSYGQANMVYYGLSRGFGHGLFINNSITSPNDVTSQNVAAAGFIMGITEATVGFHLVKSLKISNGNANLITVYGDYGYYLGISTALQIYNTAGDVNPQNISAITVTGAIGTEIAGYFIGKKYPVSTGDAEIIYSTAMLGAFLPLTFVDLTKPIKPASYTTPSALLGIAGLYIGHKLTQDIDYSFTQGFITKIGTVAGGLMGCGLTYLLIENAKSWQYFAGSYIGAQATFYMLYSIDRARFKNSKLQHVGFNFMPENFLMGRQLQKRNPQMRSYLPIVRVSYSF
jgi:hypothetical protein